MSQKLEAQIVQVQQNMVRKEKLQTMLQELYKERFPYQKKADKLYEQLRQEELDVKELESMSFKKVFYTVINKLVEKTDQEKKEAVAAKLKYDIAKKELEDIDDKIYTVREEIAQYRYIRKELKDLQKQKQQLVYSKTPVLTEKIDKLSSNLNKLINIEKRLSTAKDISKSLYADIAEAEESLRTAENWAQWDSNRHSSIIVRTVKDTYIEDMMNSLNNVCRNIRRFKNELWAADMKVSITMELIDLAPDSIMSLSKERANMRSAYASIDKLRFDINVAIIKIDEILSTSTESIEKHKAQLDELVKERELKLNSLEDKF